MMKRKANLHRFMAFLLSAVLVASSCIPAFAAGLEADVPAASVSCTETEGCRLEDGHEGGCSVAAEVAETAEIPAAPSAPETPALPAGTPDTAAQSMETPAPEESLEPEKDSETDMGEAAEAVYTLHLTHYFRFTVNGEGRNVMAEETLTLTEADFEDGICELDRFAYAARQLAVTEAKPLSIDAFGESREGGARIVYAVADGWRIVPVGEAGGSVLRDVFQGELTDYEFAPADIVRVNMEYKFSSTGGLAGVDAAAPAIVEALPVRQDDGSYAFELALPTVEGFRIVLNPAPLNYYLVSPPKGDETLEQLHQMWQNGSFSGDIKTKCIYAYQEKSGNLEAEPDYTVVNEYYGNRYSTEYNEAWNAARILSTEAYTAQAYCGDEAHADHKVGNHGANALSKPMLKVTLNEDQRKAALENGLSITISYRRNATWYTVNHWVPEEFAKKAGANIGEEDKRTEGGVTYVLLNTEREQGRVGGLTRAAAKTGGVYDLLVPLPFTQQMIQTETADTNTGTAVDIYYRAADSYRVIFNTDRTYIPRQQVKLGNEVDFSKTSEPTSKGYTFAGWQYLSKDAVPDENGKYTAKDYIPVEKDESGQYKLRVDAQLVSQTAKLQETDGVPVLHLYPIWEPAGTQVTVILWTEDLTGVDDIWASAQGGNTAYYDEKYADYSDTAYPATHGPGMGANYSNVGSFAMERTTDSSLLEDGGQKLAAEIQAEIERHFAVSAKSTTDIDPSPFYTQCSFEILHETDGRMNASTTTANADGKTMIYVYFTRNIYTLKFHYYGTGTVGGVESPYCIAADTKGFTRKGGAGILGDDGDLRFYDSSYGNKYLRATDISEPEEMPVPQTITIKAKYGADLRGVWPAAQAAEVLPSTNEGSAVMVSWTTTQGKYRDDSLTEGSSHHDEPTIMGLYATMDAEIIADPSDPGTVHHLPAYWYNRSLSYYRYNHCFEVPGLDINADGVVTLSLYNNSTALQDTLYLVPTSNEAIAKFGFTDLMEVSYDPQSGVTYDVKGGGYYAVRGYNSGSETNYYAVGRRVDTISSNRIIDQNPSARQHMTRAKSNADHTSQYGDTDGRTWGDYAKIVGKPGDYYDLYFYYNRDRYTIKYMAASTDKEDIELGRIELPSGTYVTEKDYAFKLLYTDTNQQMDGESYKYLWSYPAGGPVPVCPDRNVNGTAVWKFKGWGLGPAGVNMQWEMPDEYTPQAQAAADFYIESDLLLYAIWEAPTLKVTFHLNGGQISSRESVEVQVPANTVYNTVGTIPRPVRNGYTLTGWFLSDENGSPVDADGNPVNSIEDMTAFSFDSVIIEDRHVAAIWTTDIEETYGYTVYYVTPTLKEGTEESYETVHIGEDGSIVEGGGTVYYVLEKDVQPEQIFVSGVVLNLTAKPQPGYVPRKTNETLSIPAASETPYTAVLYYDPQTTGSHTVNFVEAGTETGDNPNVVMSFQAEADQTVLTPNAAAVKELKGYELVNKGNDGKYTTVTDYENLTWLNEAGEIQEMSTLAGDAIPDTVTYLVQPIDYTITYVCADGSPQGAAEALQAVTAGSEGGMNPTRYTVKDSFILQNPGEVYDAANGRRYRFSHWNLGEGTTAEPQQGSGGKYNTLTVSEGTMGKLTFVANWVEFAGNLAVSKTVVGQFADLQKEFAFTVTLDDPNINGTYGDMVFTGGEAKFTLKHGEKITAVSLPGGAGYVVREEPETGYETTAADDTGVIKDGETVTAAFTNTRSETVPTGLHDGMAPWGAVAGLLAALACVCAYIVCSERRRRKQGR